jgi:beta-mannosidase
MSQIISLNGADWLFKEFYGEDWRWRNAHLPDSRDRRGWRRGTVPGSPYHDLWQLGELPNPYFERNTLSCEWVAQRTWLYKKTFPAAESWRGQRLQLHCEGVDYAAQFYLNGELLGQHSSMFTPAVFEVGEQLHYGGENLLVVVIEAAPPEQPQVGRTSRVHTHKSRMPYWWDFCPRLVQLGLWQGVYLEISGPARIERPFVRPLLSAGLEQAEIFVTVEVDALPGGDVELEAALHFRGELLATFQRGLPGPGGRAPLEFQMQGTDPQRWWPNGLGAQNLYELEIQLKAAGQLSHRRLIPFGIRTIELIPNQGAAPTALPYTFVVNGRQMYAKGWNWVPLDVIYGVPRPAKLERLLTLAQRAHVNLLRVWGGGLIESQAFYTACDRLGILVWQEFIQSSSGIDNEPSTALEFVEMLVNEADQIIPRKRNHPSLALWCGGNELQDSAGHPLDDSHPTLAALKAVVSRLDPDRLWLPTSPSGPLFGNSLENIARHPAGLHDVHGPWEYQGLAQHYELYNRGAALLHSEFGLTNLKTLNAVIAPERQWPVSLDTNPLWQHLGAWWVRRAMWDQIFGELPDVASYVRATQFIQFEGLRYAVEADRRRKYHNSGSLPWQFNEPYPMAACTSAVDYYGQPKPAYYAVAQAYEPIHLSVQYPTLAWQGREQFEAEVWVCNSHERPYAGATLAIRLVGFSGKVYAEQTRLVAFEANGAALLAGFDAPLREVEALFFLDLALSHAQGQLSANRYLFTRAGDLRPLLGLATSRVALQAARRAERWEVTLTNTGEVSALGLWLEDGRPLAAPGYVFFDWNYFCLFPGETRRLVAEWQDVPEAERAIQVSGWNLASGQSLLSP